MISVFLCRTIKSSVNRGHHVFIKKNIGELYVEIVWDFLFEKMLEATLMSYVNQGKTEYQEILPTNTTYLVVVVVRRSGVIIKCFGFL